jgi:hypothetical protein
MGIPVLTQQRRWDGIGNGTDVNEREEGAYGLQACRQGDEDGVPLTDALSAKAVGEGKNLSEKIGIREK